MTSPYALCPIYPRGRQPPCIITATHRMPFPIQSRIGLFYLAFYFQCAVTGGNILYYTTIGKP